MDELDELIRKLLDAKYKPDDVMTRLKVLAHTQLYQPIFNAGYNVALARSDEDMKAAKKKADEADAALKDAQKALQKLKDETPDVAKVDREYKDQVAALNKQIQDLKDQHRQEKVGDAVEGSVTKLERLLAARIVPEYIPAITGVKANRDRITGVLGEDGKPVVRVLQKGQQIPFAGTEDEQLAAYSQELIAGVNPRFLRSDVDKGSNRDGTSAGGGTLSKREQFEEIRKKAQGKPSDPNRPTPMAVLAGRMGMKTP